MIYSSLAWELWGLRGPYKDTPLVREVIIQSAKMGRMLDNPDLGLSEAEMLGKPGRRAY
jgi:hypothetical protein